MKVVESASSAEVVVAVRAEADAYPEAGWRAAAALGWLSLVYMLFAPQVFALPWMAAIALAMVVLGIVATRALPSLRRALVGSGRREAMVQRAARSAFVELGVGITRERTGILVLVAVLERRVEVVADAAIHAKVGADALTRATRRLQAALDGPNELEMLATAIEALATVLAGPLPRPHDDIDELEDVA